MKRFIYILVFCFLTVSLAIIHRKSTDGFKLYKIYLKRPISENPPPKKILKILDQKFEYLSKGSQAYVFSSDKYILKFIAYNKYREPFRRQIFSHTHLFRNFRKRKFLNRKKNFEKALESYAISSNNLKEETQVVYSNIHCNDNFSKIITITDKTHQKHLIDLRYSFFILQKKAKPLRPYLLSLIKKKDSKKMQTIIEDYLNTSFSIVGKGVLNRDSCVKNGGYINNKFIEIDLGRFCFIENKKKAFIEHTTLYKKFFKEKAPYMLFFFDKKQKELLENL